jgi:hypothetical protein
MGTVIENEVQYLTDDAGVKTAVIVPIEEYNELLEDLHDLALIAERKNDPLFLMTIWPGKYGRL